MTQSAARVLPVLLSSLWLVACGGGSGSSEVSSPTQPTAPTVTDYFSDTLIQSGLNSHSFSTQTAGNITITVTSIGPLGTLQFGLGVGVWDGTACSVSLATDAARQGDVYTVAVATVASYCISVYDTGNIAEPMTYSIDVAHP